MAGQRNVNGIALAAGGVMVLTPDTLFMRLSGMEGPTMVAWRGLLMGAVFLTAWLLTSRDRRGDVGLLLGAAGLGAALAHGLNAWAFTSGIAAAPVAVVLIAVSTVPVWSAVLSRVFLGESTRRATWVTMALVLAGIAWAVAGDGLDVALGEGALLGAALGLAVALMLASGFVIFRRNPGLPILLCAGAGSAVSGLVGLARTGPEGMVDGRVWAIAVTGLVILPVAFFSMNAASRRTQAANVSLLLLLETVLGPIWVWWGIGEAPTPAMWTGGAIVLASLAGYLLWSARRRPPAPMPPPAA
ncbi:EamA family transporter [Aquicoccus sp. SCR17]|nr:EamA family transporter [Carideicomes alvinocaridis]